MGTTEKNDTWRKEFRQIMERTNYVKPEIQSAQETYFPKTMTAVKEDLEDQIRAWFNRRPALAINKLERESQVAQGTISKFVKGRRVISRNSIPAVADIIWKYGFRPIL